MELRAKIRELIAAGAGVFVEALRGGNCNLLELKIEPKNPEITDFLARNRKNAENVLDLVLTGKRVENERISPRKNAILAIAKERKPDVKALEDKMLGAPTRFSKGRG